MDRLLEASLDAVGERHGLKRRHWQVFNAIKQGRITAAEAEARHGPFLTNAEPKMRGAATSPTY